AVERRAQRVVGRESVDRPGGFDGHANVPRCGGRSGAGAQHAGAKGRGAARETRQTHRRSCQVRVAAASSMRRAFANLRLRGVRYFPLIPEIANRRPSARFLAAEWMRMDRRFSLSRPLTRAARRTAKHTKARLCRATN